MSQLGCEAVDLVCWLLAVVRGEYGGEVSGGFLGGEQAHGHQTPACSGHGLGPPTLPRYREAPRPLPDLVAEAAVFEEVTWRQGSKGTMTSHFTVLQVRPSGKEACRTAQEQSGGRNR